MGTMQDYSHLAEAVRARARELGYTQDDVIRISRLGRTTVQRIWSGSVAHTPSRATCIALEKALGWAPGSIAAVLAGGEPTVRRETSGDGEVQVNEASAPARASARPEFPLRVQLALEDGRPLDHDVIEFEVAGRPFSIIAWAQTGVYDTEEDRAALWEQLKVFHRLMGQLRREGDAAADGESVTGES